MASAGTSHHTLAHHHPITSEMLTTCRFPVTDYRGAAANYRAGRAGGAEVDGGGGGRGYGRGRGYGGETPSLVRAVGLNGDIGTPYAQQSYDAAGVDSLRR